MKKDNYLDPRTKSPDPDDLTNEQPVAPPTPPRRRDGSEDTRDETRRNPDSSAPHVPPPGD